VLGGMLIIVDKYSIEKKKIVAETIGEMLIIVTPSVSK